MPSGSTTCSVPTAAAAIKGGAVDFIQKLFKSRDLLDQLGKVVAGFSRSNHKVVKQMISSASFPGQEPLTRRERDVLQLVATGSNNKTIGETLGISYRIVEEYRSNIMHKLRAKNVAELLVAVPR
jgi:FixJ family two-component response regulator